MIATALWGTLRVCVQAIHLESTGWLKKSKLLILAVNEINASQTRVSFAKFISKLVEEMFDMCSTVPNYSLKSLSPFVYTLLLMNVCDSRFHSVTSACFNWSTDQTAVEDTLAVEEHPILHSRPDQVGTIRRPTLRLNEVYFLLQQEADCVSSCVRRSAILLNNTQLDRYET